MIRINSKVVKTLHPWSSKVLRYQRNITEKFVDNEASRVASSFRYKGVASLVGFNVAAFMFLNSHYMKSRSHVDGLQRSDRHFIASRYNFAQGRIWCIPLSLFNHGDSLMHLFMNSFGLSVVGPAVEIAFGAGPLIAGFLFAGTFGAILEMTVGHHWCRGASAGVTGIFGISAFTVPNQIFSIWGILDVRAAPLAITMFGIEALVGLFGSGNSDMAHVAHAGGILASIPFLYYMRWFGRRIRPF